MEKARKGDDASGRGEGGEEGENRSRAPWAGGHESSPESVVFSKSAFQFQILFLIKNAKFDSTTHTSLKDSHSAKQSHQ